MSASYPTSTKSFTTKVDGPGHTISASHVNDLQDEIVAIENGLRAGLAHDLLFTDATYDIGKSGATRPRDGFFSRNVTIGGALTVGTLTIPTLAQSLLFTDATYDIGASGATRPRDLFLSRLLDLSGAAAGQVKFPAAQNASTDVNTLDDYEEGTFTPTIVGSTSGAATYTAQAGFYTKIGKRVFFNLYVGTATAGTLVGNIRIGGLPFASQNTSFNHAGMVVSYFTGLGSNVVFLSGYTPPNTQYVELYKMAAAAAAVSNVVTADIGSTDFIISGSYQASA